jgi:uncharacterized protein YukE
MDINLFRKSLANKQKLLKEDVWAAWSRDDSVRHIQQALDHLGRAVQHLTKYTTAPGLDSSDLKEIRAAIADLSKKRNQLQQALSTIESL